VMDLGPSRTTMAEVARRAGVSRMTLYRRYDDLTGCSRRCCAPSSARRRRRLGRGPAAHAGPASSRRAATTRAVAAPAHAPGAGRTRGAAAAGRRPARSTQRHVRECSSPSSPPASAARRRRQSATPTPGCWPHGALHRAVVRLSARVVDATTLAYDELALIVDRYLEEAA
jgi:AcrR family transcriptional regulator